jgi:hypothetical protein
MAMTPVDARAQVYRPSELQTRQLNLHDQFNRAIRATASAKSTGLIDAEAEMRMDQREKLLDFDGIHLTQEGQAALAQVVFRQLEQDGTLRFLERERDCDDAGQ